MITSLATISNHPKCGDQTLRAIQLIQHYHHGQVDKNDQPYTEHLIRVALNIENPTDDLLATALLHDIIEDTACTADQLIAARIKESVITSVKLLTRTAENTDTYYAQIKENPQAFAVKIADITDNLNPDRLTKLPVKIQEKLQKKYQHALICLLGENYHDNLPIML